MPLAAWIAIAGIAVTIVVGFAATMRTLGRIELKLDLLWQWYLAEHQAAMFGGRRRTDPPPCTPAP